MTGKQFMEGLGQLDSRYLTEVLTYKPWKKTVWLRWGALAACLVLILWAEFLALPDSVGQGMGYEGYLAYDSLELVTGNPWSEEATLESLPVFQNPLSYDDRYHLASGADFDAMEALLLEVAERLGLDPTGLTVTDNAPDQETKEQQAQRKELSGAAVPDNFFDPTLLETEGEGIHLEVDLKQTVTVRLDQPISLPENLHFARDASPQELEEAAAYLMEEYGDWLGMEEPRIAVSGGDYDTEGKQKYSLAFYEGTGDLVGQMVAYNFRQVVFYPNEEGELYMVRFFFPDLSGKVGDYPILSLEEAEKLLEKGHYLTTVAQEMPGTEYLVRTELVYRSGDEEYWLPYYRFYLELPGEEENGLKTYGTYYVPAVEPEYLSQLPAWDGTFN